MHRTGKIVAALAALLLVGAGLTACMPQGGGAEGETAGIGGGLMTILPLVLIFVVFYFLIIRPQQKKTKGHRAMLDSVRRGDQVITGGGIIGNVMKVDRDDNLHVEIADGVRVKVTRASLSEVITRPTPIGDDDDDEDEDYEDEIENENEDEDETESPSRKRKKRDK